MKTLRLLTLLLFKLCKSGISRLCQWTEEKIKYKNFEAIYALFGIIIAVMTIYLYRHSNLVVNFFLLAILVIVLAIKIIILIEIRKLDRGKEYFNHLSNWSFSMIIISLFISMRIIHFIPSIINLFVLFFFAFIYFKARYLFLDKVTNWFYYVLLLLMTPILSAFLYSFIGMFFYELFNEKLFIADATLGWMIIFLSIVLINLVVYWTPEERFDEAKVAIYFLLAIFSTISYCFFVSEFLSDLITPRINSISNFESITADEVSNFIEDVVRWFTLPYLIGSVFSCFSLELVSRNRAIASKKIIISNMDNNLFTDQV